MRKVQFALLLIAFAVLLVAVKTRAQDSAPQPVAAEKIAIPVRVQPSELRTYAVTVQMKGRVSGQGTEKPIDVDALASMRIRHQYGRREGDGLLSLEVSALSPEVTMGGQKMAMPATDFPKMTLLLDGSWKVSSVFGLAGSRYAGQVPSLNYGNLITLFFVPDGDKPHAVGEKWLSKVKLPGPKLPGSAEDVEVTSTIKSLGDTGGVKSVTVSEDWAWFTQKLDAGPAYNKVTAESVFALDTGKLLKSHAECLILYQDPATRKQEDQDIKSNTKIDILLGS